MGYLLEQWLQTTRNSNIDPCQAVLRHYLENSWEMLQYPLPWTCLCYALQSLLTCQQSKPTLLSFRRLLVSIISKMGYYIRLFRIIPDEPPAHKENLRDLLRWLYKTVLQFGMLIVAVPAICFDSRAAAMIRAEVYNRETDVMLFESNWVVQRLERALELVVDFGDYESDTRYNDMESSQPDYDTLDHPTSLEQSIGSAHAVNRSQSYGPVL
ncbi:hypothetical protein J3F84DRAFT_366222 [Trichoderma pleuroticola]